MTQILIKGEGKNHFERKIVERSKGYSLHQLIYSLQNNPYQQAHLISDEEIGLIYSAIVLSQVGGNYVGENRPGEEVLRGIKKRFQESTRSGLYLLKHHLELGGVPFSRLKKDYLDALQEARSQSYLFKSGIEGRIYTEINSDPDFELIGEKVKTGAEIYHRNYFSKGSDKRFLEYNRIQSALER